VGEPWVPPPKKRAVALERVERERAGAHCVADLVLGARLRLGPGEDLLRHPLRHDDDAVPVADDPVAGLDPDVANLDRHLCRGQVPAPGAVLGRDEASEDDKPLVDDEARVPAAAVDHAPRHAARGERHRGQLAEVRRAVVIRRVDGDVARGHAAQHRQRLADRSVPVAVLRRLARHRERLAGHRHARRERTDLGRQRLVAQAAIVEDVGQHGGVDGGEAVAH